MNIWGLRESSWLNIIFTSVEVGGLLLVVAAGFMNDATPQLTMPAQEPAIMAAAALLFFVYLGFEEVANLAEEVRHPSRDLAVAPRTAASRRLVQPYSISDESCGLPAKAERCDPLSPSLPTEPCGSSRLGAHSLGRQPRAVGYSGLESPGHTGAFSLNLKRETAPSCLDAVSVALGVPYGANRRPRGCN